MDLPAVGISVSSLTQAAFNGLAPGLMVLFGVHISLSLVRWGVQWIRAGLEEM